MGISSLCGGKASTSAKGYVEEFSFTVVGLKEMLSLSRLNVLFVRILHCWTRARKSLTGDKETSFVYLALNRRLVGLRYIKH